MTSPGPATDPSDGRAGIDAALVRRLLREQHPRWADLPVQPVAADGHDNRTYRLGDHLTVRLPTAPGYAAAVATEHAWLPVLGPHLPLEVPEPVGVGEPSELFDRPWSVRRWIDGEPLTTAVVPQGVLAADLAGFLVALRAVGTTGAPAAGPATFHRGGDLATYDEEARACLAGLDPALLRLWERALASRWDGPPVWFHGDVAVGNLLARGGRLAAVIDFGQCGAGDPACDLVVAWTHFDSAARAVFRDRTGLDDDTWARARGWAVWKAALTLRERGGHDAEQERVLARLLTSG